MEDPLFSNLMALGGLLLALLIVLWSARRSRSRNRRLNLPPEIPGSWPIIGHLHKLREPVPLQRTLASMADCYGPVFMFRLGVHPVVVVSTHESVRECFTTNDRALASRPKSKAGTLLGYNYAAFSLSGYGNYWREMRKLTVLELLGHRRVEALRHVQVSEINNLITGIYKSVIASDSNGQVGNKKPITICHWLENMTLDIITRMLTGKRYFGSHDGGSSGEEDADKVTRVIKGFMQAFGFPVLSDMIPYTGWMDFGGSVKAMKNIVREFDAIAGRWIEEHKQRRAIEGEKRKQDMDFIDVMLSVIEDNSNLGYSKDIIIKATLVNIIVAASDSTSVNLTWVVSLLLNHKHCLAKAQEELDLKVGRDRWAQDSDVDNLPYLQAIVKETLRLYPPGPLGAPHLGDEDCAVNGYFIPKGTQILVNVWKLHRDPRVWSDPESFIPERFLPGGHAAGLDGSGHHFEFIPFGAGRRACPGATLALQVTYLTLARLLQAFNMSTPDNTPLDMTEGMSLTLPKVNPVEALVSPRLPAKLFEELMESC